MNLSIDDKPSTCSYLTMDGKPQYKHH
jgi:hypothetical protein